VAEIDSLEALLARVMRLVATQGDEPAGDGAAAMTLTEGVVLVELLGAGEVTQAQLSARLRVDKNRMSRVCSSLERKGLVARERDERNRRNLVVRITGEGTTAAKRLRETWRERHERMLGAMTAEERQGLMLGLRALARELDGFHPPQEAI